MLACAPVTKVPTQVPSTLTTLVGRWVRGQEVCGSLTGFGLLLSYTRSLAESSLAAQVRSFHSRKLSTAKIPRYLDSLSSSMLAKCLTLRREM